ncbi:MAG: glycosyltransferase family 4 protein [Chloroflexi bacterium]|nr:glycosyltransferase family 4 protein [Chloroflexota bacterium]
MSRPPIKVAYLLWSGGLGGAERHVYDLATRMPPASFSPMVCFLSIKGTYGDLFTNAGIPITEARLRNGYDLGGAVRLLSWMRDQKFDLVHDHISTPWARVAIGMATPQSRVVYTEHNGLLGSGLHSWGRFWGRLSAHYTDQFIAVSQYMKDELVSNFRINPDRVEVVHNFVDSARFSLAPNVCRSHTCQSVGLPLDGRLLIAIGRLDANKAFDRLVTMLAPMLRGDSNLHLLIVGEGPMKAQVKAQIDDLHLRNQVHLLGRRLDVPQLLCAADVFVLASRYESFAIVAAEAMMARKPVVAPNIPGLNEVVVSGETGILVDESRLGIDFCDAVRGLLRDPAKRCRMGQAGYQRALALFEREKNTNRIFALYEKVLNAAQTSAD